MAIEQDAMNVEQEIEDYLAATDSRFQEEEVISEEVEDNQTEVEDVEEDIVEDSTEEETEVEVDESEEEESDAPWMPSNLEELAAAMEVEPDDLKSIRVKTKVDGVEGEATLSDVIKSYQFDKSLTERSEAFSHEKKQFAEQLEKVQAQVSQKLQDAETLTLLMEERLQGDIAQVDWDTLRIENPAEWSVKRQEFMEKIGEVESAKAQIVQSREAEMQKATQDRATLHKQMLDYNQSQLLDAIPEFKDSEVLKSEMAGIKDYLKANNVSDEEINTIVDYRMVVLARKAKAYDEMQTKAQPAKMKAKGKPKFTKPGSVKSKQNQQDSRTNARYKRASKSNDVDDWAKVLEDRI